MLNVTVVNPQAAGHVGVFPCPSGGDVPNVSSVNYLAGQVTANAVLTGVDLNDGSVCVYTHATTDVIIDVVGWTQGPDLAGVLELSQSEFTLASIDDHDPIPVTVTGPAGHFRDEEVVIVRPVGTDWSMEIRYVEVDGDTLSSPIDFSMFPQCGGPVDSVEWEVKVNGATTSEPLTLNRPADCPAARDLEWSVDPTSVGATESVQIGLTAPGSEFVVYVCPEGWTITGNACLWLDGGPWQLDDPDGSIVLDATVPCYVEPGDYELVHEEVGSPLVVTRGPSITVTTPAECPGME